MHHGREWKDEASGATKVDYMKERAQVVLSVPSLVRSEVALRDPMFNADLR